MWPSGATCSVEGRALGVSGDGSVIVGEGNNASYSSEAFYWSQSVGMQRLWDTCLGVGINPATAGWTRLIQASAVSSDGLAIAGYGYRNGNYEGFILTIPEPLTLACTTLLLGRVMLRRAG